MPLKNSVLAASIAGCVGTFFTVQPALAHVSIGDPTGAGGVSYHLNYAVHNTGTDYSARSGQALEQTPGSVFGTGGDSTDTGSNLVVDTIGSRSWHDRQSINNGPGGTGGTSVPGEYGWGHTSRWSLIDLNDLYDDGITRVKVTVSLSNYDDPNVAGDQDLVPGLTVWKGAGLTDNFPQFHTYVNGGTSTNWNDWGASTDLKNAALAGNVWWDADNSSNPDGTAQVSLYLTLIAGGNNFLTAVFGGNELLPPLGPAAGHAVSFLGNVRVEAVPVPAAFWLFGSALVGLGSKIRRRAA